MIAIACDCFQNHHPGPEAPGNIINSSNLRRRNATEKDVDEVDMQDFEVINVENECGLLLLLKGRNIEFSRGCSYYEFVNDREDISKDVEIILMHKV